MNLWDRIERWRGATKAISAEGAERPLEWEGKDILRMCADDLEADLRELQKLAAKWRKEAEADTAGGRLENPWVMECADELEKAIGPLRS